MRRCGRPNRARVGKEFVGIQLQRLPVLVDRPASTRIRRVLGVPLSRIANRSSEEPCSLRHTVKLLADEVLRKLRVLYSRIRKQTAKSSVFTAFDTRSADHLRLNVQAALLPQDKDTDSSSTQRPLPTRLRSNKRLKMVPSPGRWRPL